MKGRSAEAGNERAKNEEAKWRGTLECAFYHRPSKPPVMNTRG
jgi:hypothetical protein